jgi:hypothetical protein
MALHINQVSPEVENPVAEYNETHNGCIALLPAQRILAPAEYGAPEDGSKETVRPRIIVEIQRRECRVSRIDPDMLESEQQKEGPEQIH